MTRHTRSSVPRVSMYAGACAHGRRTQREIRRAKRWFCGLLAVLAVAVYWLVRVIVDFFEGAIR